MFNDCPAEIKKMILARVRLIDLYEVSRVSQEWWTLTMATCRPTNDKYSSFWKFQVEFCNKLMPKEGGWKVWMFIEFTDDKSIALNGAPDEKMIEYFREKEIRVRKLIYRGEPSVLPNLKELFPHLTALNFTLDSDQYDGEAVELPDGIKHLRLNIFGIHPRSQLRDFFKHFERVNSLHILSRHRIIFGNIRFDKLKHLHFDMYEQTTQDMKSLINGSKQLSSVHLFNGQIDKDWLGLFPTNIQKIQLNYMRLNEAMAPLLGTGEAFVERQLMRFVCQDWTKIRIFKCSELSSDDSYSATYVCRPLVLEEQLEIRKYRDRLPKGALVSGKLQLKVLKLREGGDTKRDLDIIVPKSVVQFEWTANKFEAINFAVLFEDISTIKTLRLNSICDEKVQFSDFTHAANLVSLVIPVVDDVILVSILSNCPSLKQLSLKRPRGMPFSKLPAELKSSSVKELTIIGPKDSIVNIVGHFPCLVDLHLQDVNMQTVMIADLAILTSVEFVCIEFVDVNDFVVFNLLVNHLDNLSFSQLVFGFSRLYSTQWLSCIMGREEAFFRFLSLRSINDLSNMNIQQLSDFFLYVKGIPSLHLSSWSENSQISYDLQDFITKALTEFQNEDEQ